MFLVFYGHLEGYDPLPGDFSYYNIAQITDLGWGENVLERIEVAEEKAVNIAHCRDSVMKYYKWYAYYACKLQSIVECQKLLKHTSCWSMTVHEHIAIKGLESFHIPYYIAIFVKSGALYKSYCRLKINPEKYPRWQEEMKQWYTFIEDIPFVRISNEFVTVGRLAFAVWAQRSNMTWLVTVNLLQS